MRIALTQLSRQLPYMAPPGGISNLLQPTNAWLMLITWVYLLMKDRLLVWWRHLGKGAALKYQRCSNWAVAKQDANRCVCIVTGVCTFSF
jgi:hypothetical protein